MERNIRVTGKGSISVEPDTTVITLGISGIRTEYSDAVEASAADSKEVKDALEKLGLERDKFKTTFFSIDDSYESYRDKNGDHKNKFVGYEYDQKLRFEFPSDNAFLGKVMYTASRCKCAPTIKITYTISDPEGAKNKLLGLAVDDAKKKAVILSGSAGVSLGDIVSIDYSWSTISFEANPIRHVYSAAEIYEESTIDVDIKPDDIHASDTVTIIWSIF